MNIFFRYVLALVAQVAGFVLELMMRVALVLYAKPPSDLKQTVLSPLRPKGRKALAFRQSVAVVSCLGFHIPQVLSSYRPTLFHIYSQDYSTTRSSEQSVRLSPHVTIHRTGEPDGPCLLWIAMPWELDVSRLQFLRRLGHSTRCNIATLVVSWDLGVSPQDHVETAISIIDSLPSLFNSSKLVLGGCEMGACLALLVIEAKSTGAGAGSFAGAVAGSFDMFCAGALLVDPFVGWKRMDQEQLSRGEPTSLQLKRRLMRASASVTHSQVSDWFPAVHSFVAPPLFVLSAADSLWENEQTTFFTQCRGGYRFGNEVFMRQYTIVPASTGMWIRRWETTDIECAMSEVECWLREKAFSPGNCGAHTPREQNYHDGHATTRISGFQPITPAREHRAGNARSVRREQQQRGRLVDAISGEDINEISEVVVRRSFAADAAMSTNIALRSIPMVSSYSSVDES